MKRLLKRIIYRFVPYCFLYPFFRIFGRLQVKGLENLSGGEGLLIASNHLSYIDPPLLATIIPGGCLFMAKQEVFNIPVLRHLISYYAFPVNRERPGALAIKTALAKLELGEKVVIFPEGSRNRGSMSLPPKNGIGMFAVSSGKKVIPVLLKGTDKLLPHDKLLPRPASISVTFGGPLDLDLADEDYGRLSSLIMEGIMKMDNCAAVSVSDKLSAKKDEKVCPNN